MLTLSAARPDKLVNTQLKVDTREAFQHYTNATESATDITFNLKDFRHMLALAEGLGANIALLFDRPGHPLIVEPRPRQQDPQASLWQLTAPSFRRTVVSVQCNASRAPLFCTADQACTDADPSVRG